MADPGAAASAAIETAPSLAAILAVEPPMEAREIVATGAEVLSLDASQRARLEQWLRRGGRLVLGGEAEAQALRSLAPRSEPARGATAVGLGEVASGRAPGPSSASGPIDLSGAAGAAARLLSRDDPPPGRLTAVRLATYVVLLLGLLRAGRGFPPRWRAAALTLLASAFALWPWWSRSTGWAADRASQVDIVAHLEETPPLLWSAAELRPGARRSLRIHPGPGTFGLRVAGSPGLSAEPRIVREAGEPEVAFEAARGSQVGLEWMAEGGLSGEVRAEVTEREGRLRGLLRNESDLRWTNVRLHWPGFEPLALGDLPAGGACVVDARPEPGADDAHSAASLPAGCESLLRVVERELVAPLLARGTPVVVALSEAPARPLAITPGGASPRGLALLVAAVADRS